MTVQRPVVAGMAAAAVFALIAAPAWSNDCSATKAGAAAVAADNIHSWGDVFSFFNRYRDCDDGGIADVTTEAVMRLLANHWEDTPKLGRLVGDNPPFKSFVLSHVDSTASTSDLERARQQSLRHCPTNLHSLCRDIAAAAKEAMQ